ncbi:hypothetical protein HU200_066872 [Digitaria exilis]|uniref:Uncharacterized protein n=1 Tax=Digitaria exilis TaxID=1010633 RepID=A0A834ZWH7_9POAL|nr:hypothetical protein HU200_066872 [Digitaria exilis]
MPRGGVPRLRRRTSSQKMPSWRSSPASPRGRSTDSSASRSAGATSSPTPSTASGSPRPSKASSSATKPDADRIAASADRTTPCATPPPSNGLQCPAPAVLLIPLQKQTPIWPLIRPCRHTSAWSISHRKISLVRLRCVSTRLRLGCGVTWQANRVDGE